MFTTGTVILIDATGSMGAVIDAVKSSVKEIFQRAQAVLVKEGIQAGFEMQVSLGDCTSTKKIET